MRTNDKPYGIEKFIVAEVMRVRPRKIEKNIGGGTRESSARIALFPVIYTYYTIKMNIRRPRNIVRVVLSRITSTSTFVDINLCRFSRSFKEYSIYCTDTANPLFKELGKSKARKEPRRWN